MASDSEEDVVSWMQPYAPPESPPRPNIYRMESWSYRKWLGYFYRKYLLFLVLVYIISIYYYYLFIPEVYWTLVITLELLDLR